MADQELVVKFKGDTSDIDKAFAKVKSQLNDIPNTTNKASKSIDNLGKSTENLGNSFNSFAKGYLGVAAVLAGGKMFLDATKQVQKYENQLKVASGTQADYAKNTAFLESLADKYNKNVIDLGANFAKLTIATRGTNLEGAKTERLFAAVTAASAALQMTTDETNGTLNAFIQMVSKGNVQAEELRGQLGERLYGAFNLAAKAMGKTTQELNGMLQRGEVLAEDLLPKLTVELEKTFGSQAQQNADNLGSNIEYATGQATLLFAEFGKSSGLTDGLNSMAGAVGRIFSQLRKLNSESGIVGGFFDRMFTLPGSKLGGKRQDNSFDIAKKNLDRAIANLGKENTTPFSGAQSTTNTDAYGAQFGIRDANPKAEAKIRKQNEVAANRATSAINKWIAEEIEKSKDRIAEGLLNNEIANDNAFRTNNGFINPVGAKLPTGLTNNYTMSGDKTGQSFTNESTGDGTTNYDHIVAGMDGAIKKAQESYKRFQGITDDFGENFNKSMQNAFAGSIDTATEGMGQLIAGLASGTAGWEDVGNFFLGVVVTVFQSIGKALSAYAATLIAAKMAFKTASIPGALIGAALAFGGAAIAQAAIGSAGEQAFWTGGIVQGQGGVDNVHTALSPGEMVLNGSQQNRLWGMVSGANSGREFSSGFGSNSGNDDIAVNVYGRLKGTDIDISGSKGKRKNNYFR